MELGLIGLDLGVTTGMAWGIFNPALKDDTNLWTALARGKKVGWKQVYSEDTLGAAILVATLTLDKIAEFNLRGLGKADVRVCIEDFQARPQSVRGGKAKDKLAPVFFAGVVSGALSGAGWGSCIRWFDPSLSMAKANDKRLKNWASQTRPKGKMGWVVGKQHARDACRLIATGLEKEV